VTYICSNLALADENRKKLAIFKGAEQQKFVKEPSFGRLAELALFSKEASDEGKVLEVCSLTPSTSFSLTQGFGNMRERCIIFSALVQHPQLKNHQAGLKKLFQRVGDDSWKIQVDWVSNRKWNKDIVKDFYKSLETHVDDSMFTGYNSWLELLKAIDQDFDSKKDELENKTLRKVRVMFVKSCAANLTADLFILDEFQRFKSLIDTDEENEQSIIANQVFSKQSLSKILLLSATPFKAMTTIEEDETDEAHLVELKKVLSFLNMNSSLDCYEQSRQALQVELLRLKQDGMTVAKLSDKPRSDVEAELRPLICRTERAQIAKDVDTVLEVIVDSCDSHFGQADILAFKTLDGVAQKLSQIAKVDSQLMDFYKSAAWPLSFSSGYKLRGLITKYGERDTELGKYLQKHRAHLWVPKNKINDYKLNLTNEAPNAKVRQLSQHLFGSDKIGPEMMLWMPPSLPHYQLALPFAAHANFSKSLIFSSWAMVPRMLSGLLSYEAERRSLGLKRIMPPYFDKQAHNPVLHFDGKSTLASWAFVYPSKTLIDMPLERSNQPLEEIVALRVKRFDELLGSLKCYESNAKTKPDNWYALAPMLLDRAKHHDWLTTWLDEQIQIVSADGRRDKLTIIEKMLNSEKIELSQMPEDLSEFLALLSIASPAVCAARALERVNLEIRQNDLNPEIESGDSTISLQATAVAFAFSQLFNSAEGFRIVSRFSTMKKQKALHGILLYCANGGLQSLLDEYVYMLGQSCRTMDEMVTTICDTAAIPPSRVAVQNGVGTKDFSLRCHYAVAFGTQKMDVDQGLQRVANIRDAFNSPFRPFVLTSTSVGQEGLDFHWYCGEVVHWNLPHNPIDLEQREGRVNRFQSLVVRRRVAEQFATEIKATEGWKEIFEKAADILSKQPNHTDLIPYWHTPIGSAKIRRIVPMMPLSRETRQYEKMLKILSLYRLTFGQPRQQELLEYLLRLNLSTEDEEELRRKMMINLAPISYCHL
jgi:hypothetical protein